MTTADHRPVWWPAADIARHYDVATSTVNTWIRRGYTTRHTSGLVDFAALDRYLAARPTDGPRSGFHTGAARPGADEHDTPTS